MYDDYAHFDSPAPASDDDPTYLWVVHYRSVRQNRRGVFYATDEDTALKFCIHYTTLEKFSREIWWELVIYRELADDLRRRETTFVAGVNQDGLPVDQPPMLESESPLDRVRAAFGITPPPYENEIE